MICNDCTPLLEDYLYHKLGPTEEKHLLAHLGACSECAAEYELLRREQQIYARCELQVAPELWARVQARITSESESRFGRFAGVLNVLRFDPVVAVVTAVLLVAGLGGLWGYLGTRSAAEVQNAQAIDVAMPEQKKDSGEEKVEEGLVAGMANDTSSRKRFLRSNNLRRRGVRKTEKTPLAASVVTEERPMLSSLRNIATDLDADSARHIEQVEMLLRSFKNGRLLRQANTLDINYESRLSRDLLAHNTLLRRDAEFAGNVALARLLDRFEPFLRDIANLSNNADRKEILLVKDRLTSTQIIAALQAF